MSGDRQRDSDGQEELGLGQSARHRLLPLEERMHWAWTSKGRIQKV